MAKYRSSASALAKSFERSSALIYLVDQSGTILFANPACETWLGVETGSLFGKTVRYSSDFSATDSSFDPSERSAETELNALAPPPEVFAERGEQSEPIRFLISSSPNSTAHSAAHSAAHSGPHSAPHQAGALTRYRWALAIPVQDLDLDEVSSLVVSQSLDLPEKPASLPDHSVANQAHVALLELRRQLQKTYQLDSLMGVSSFSKRLRRQAAMAAANDLDLYIFGPPGSGKEFLARTIHTSRLGAGQRDLIPLQGTLADADMIRSVFLELSQKQQQARRRDFSTQESNLADSLDVLLLINADRLHPTAQVELNRQLNSTNVFRCVIATGERSLQPLVLEGEFLAELASLLSPMTLELVPLWQRAEDIPLLAQKILEGPGRKQPVAGLDPAAIQLLVEYRWPGNLNQLRDFISQAGPHARDRLLTPDDLPKKFHDSLLAQRLAPSAETTIHLENYLESIERELILRAIGQVKGNKTQAAHLLGLSRAKLLRRIEALALDQAIDQFYPATDSVLVAPATPGASIDGELGLEEKSRPAKPSRLREKLIRRPPLDDLATESLDSREPSKADSADPSEKDDQDWVTPDAFEEID